LGIATIASPTAAALGAGSSRKWACSKCRDFHPYESEMGLGATLRCVLTFFPLWELMEAMGVHGGGDKGEHEKWLFLVRF
jgi:hypothetical protein